MALVDITKSCLDAIIQISELIEGAILYLDAGCVESFQLIGAFPVLLNLGVRGICSLENMASLDAVVDWNLKAEPAKKLVVISSRLLSDAHRYILRCLSTHQGVRHCTIFTSISEIAHSAYPDSPLGPDAFHEYESLLVQDYNELVKKGEKTSGQFDDSSASKEKITDHAEEWPRFSSSEEEISPLEASSSGENTLMSRIAHIGKKLVVSVLHFPMIVCPFSPRVFVLPSAGSVVEASLSLENEDSLSHFLPSLSNGLSFDGDDVPPGATLTAHFLYHLAAKMDLKMEIFSLGDLSKSIGKILTDMSSLYDVGRRKRSAGLLLVDRTLDLLTPCCHGDSLIDRMFLSLPRGEKVTYYSQIKGSRMSLKNGTDSLKRAPLNFRIPVDKIVTEENCETDKFQLSERIKAFSSGWDSGNSTFQNEQSSNWGSKVQNEDSSQSDGEILNGSFVTTENFRGTPYLEAIFDRKSKDGAVLIKKWLQETLKKEKISSNVKTRAGFVSKLELQSMIKALVKSQSSLLKHKGIIQLATAATVALDESRGIRWDAFTSAEKILRASATDTSQTLAAQMADLINKSALEGVKEQKKGVLSLQDALLLVIIGYILAGENFPTSGSEGPFSWQEEHFLKEAIVDAILENPSIAKLKFLHGLSEELEANKKKVDPDESNQTLDDLLDDFDEDQWGNWGDEDADSNNKDQTYGNMQLKLELRYRVDNLFKTLHKVSTLKRRNLALRNSLDSENLISDDQDASKGLLYKLLSRVLTNCDVPGLEHHSSTMGRLFKSGFGRFGLGQAKPSLAEQNIILVFVVGGINALEVREAREALSGSGRPDIELILGGTTLLTPDDMLDLLLGNS